MDLIIMKLISTLFFAAAGLCILWIIGIIVIALKK